MNCNLRSPSSPKAPHLDSFDIDFTPRVARHDLSPDGDITAEQPANRILGPRQRRFEFDAKIIRDSVVRKLRTINRDDIADPIDQCHREAVYKRCCGCRHVKTFYNRCERFYCPVCAARLARDRRETVEWWSKVVGQPKHMVLTVKSVAAFDKSYVRTLKADFVKLRNQLWAKAGRAQAIACVCPWAQAKPFTYWRAVFPTRFFILVDDGMIYRRSTQWYGGFWSLDVTWNPPRQAGELATVAGRTFRSQDTSAGGFHVHFHIAVDANFIDGEWLERAWSKIRGQEFSVVEVKNVKGTNYTAEVCKYVCDGIQLGNWPPEIIAQFIDALSEEKCFGTFGCLYKQRAEWRKAMDDIQADRAMCECGCSQFQFFDESEWEWQQIKSDLAPPPPQKPKPSPEPQLGFSL